MNRLDELQVRIQIAKPGDTVIVSAPQLSLAEYDRLREFLLRNVTPGIRCILIEDPYRVQIVSKQSS